MKKSSKNRILKKASHTALMAAVYRFLASKENNHGIKGPDNISYIFLPFKAKVFLSFNFVRRFFIKKLHQKVPGSYEYITARTNYFDKIFHNAIKENIPQIVFLGAGYDTRSIRFQETANSKIFELDIPTTQNQKIKLLKRSKISIPENLSYVSINFNKDDLKQVLVKAGYNPQLKTLFLWEGVTMYLSDEAIKETLSFIKYNSGIDSTIAFDYLYSSLIDGKCNYYGAKELAKVVEDKGEPFTFGIDEGNISEFLQEKGFSIISHYSPEEFEKKYLCDDKGIQLGKMYGFAAHVYAKVQS